MSKERIINEISNLRSAKSKIDIQIGNIVKSVYPDYGFWHTLGSWECDESPIGLCLYNHFDDPALDNCIFCGHPHERK